jgi:hypothetical protein
MSQFCGSMGLKHLRSSRKVRTLKTRYLYVTDNGIDLSVYNYGERGGVAGLFS